MNQSTTPGATRCSRKARGRTFNRSWKGAAVAVGLVGAMVLGFGCARPSTSKWAQTSKIMTADSTTDTTVNLGLRD